MTDAREALALEKRDKAFTNRSKIGCITKADAQLAIARLQGGLHELAASSLRRRRGTAIRARGQPEAQPLGGPARELPESVLKQLEVHLVKSDSGELEPALFRRVTVKKEPALRRWVPIDDMVKLVDTEYTFNAGKKAGINTLESRLRHLTATKIYSADGKVLNTVHGVVGVPREVIELTLQQCPVHADRRPQQHAAKPRLVPIVVNRAFWQCQLDLIDLGEGRDDGFRYVLVYIDLLTRHVWLRALATKEPISVAREVNGIWMETQVPAVLQSDNGVEFCADIMEALCSEYGVQHITSSIGHPQSQGATERCNREIKDYIRSLLMQAPAISWGYQVRHVQRMVNDAPTTALGGMTRSESLFGAPSMTAKLPSAETIIKLLGFTNSTEAVNPNGGIPTRAPAAAPRKPKSGWASRRSRSKAAAGRKRAAAELSEDEDAAAVSDEEASPAQEGQQQQQQQQQQDRSGLRRSAAVHRAWLADLSDDDAEAGVARTLPPRAAAESSPAGLRRQRRRLTQGSDALARLADVAMAADGEAPAVAGEAQQAAGPAAAAGEAQQAANAAAAAAAAGEAQQAVGPAGEAQQAAGAAGEPAFQLPEHLQKARAATMAAQQKRAERVQNSRQGPPRAAFSVGDSVMLWVKAQGRVGRSVDRKRLPCRVVAVRHSFGKQIRYTLRCNAGVLKGTYADGVEPATAADAASLTFRGTASSGPGIKVNITPQQGVKQHAQIAVITV